MSDVNLLVCQYLWERAGDARSLEHARILRKAALILKQYAEGETNDESGSKDT